MKTQLTKLQKEALWGLIKYPALNDRETADKVRMKLSTMTTIRYKMINEGYYKTVNAPLVNRMGFELCAFFVLRLKSNAKGKPLSVRKGEYPNLVYIAHDQNRVLVFGFYPDYTRAQADSHSLVSRMTKTKSLARSGHWWKFISLKNNDVLSYFEMSPFVNKGLDMNKSEAKTTKGSVFKGDPIHISFFERKVFQELVAFPDATDIQISNNLNITRSTVARIRERFLGLSYKTLNIVDLAKVNYKAISITAPRLRFSFTGSRSALVRAANFINFPLFLSVGDYGAVFITAHKELKGVKKITNSVFRGGPFHRHIKDPPHIATFNLKQLTVLRNHQYVPLIKQALMLYEYKSKKRGKKRKK